jgi:hypothetical protein
VIVDGQTKNKAPSTKHKAQTETLLWQLSTSPVENSVDNFGSGRPNAYFSWTFGKLHTPAARP